jgi:NAD(P)-dependent dehydrogenase (short-subunit alcohol dehydrogenase family)
MMPTYLVTGATDGIGKATALALANQDACVILHGRNPDKTAATLEEISQATGNTQLHSVLADFASLEQVAALADEVSERFPDLNILINNAGHLNDHRRLSIDGFELTFGVNYLAPFLLTLRLLDTLKSNSNSNAKAKGRAPARIVNVSSTALGGGLIDLDNLQLEHGYNGWQAYANSKLANAMFSHVLADKLQGTGVVSNALCPGLIDTNFFHTNEVFSDAAYQRMRPGMRSPEEGALVPLYLATDPAAGDINGEFFIRQGRDDRRAMPLDIDESMAQQLWAVSEQLTGS